VKNSLLAPVRLFEIYLVSYFFNILIAISQLLNALLGGDPSVSLSMRADRANEAGKLWGRPATACIDFVLGRGHCRDAAPGDEGFGDYWAGVAKRKKRYL